VESLEREVRSSAAVLYICGEASRTPEHDLEPLLHFARGVPPSAVRDASESGITRRSNIPYDLTPGSLASDKPVIPVLIDNGSADNLPAGLRDAVPADLRGARFNDGLTQLVAAIDRISQSGSTDSDPDDPEKGRWGGRAMDRGRVLSATVYEIADGWYSIELALRSTNGPLDGEVVFHVHPSFPRPVRRIPVVDGKATLTLCGWGAFTVGAEADNGHTTLELDLAQDPSLPAAFRAR
jgi:hypothetical protein